MRQEDRQLPSEVREAAKTAGDSRKKVAAELGGKK